MARQPSYKPLEPSAFFTDGRSARPIPAGTVARGQLAAEDTHLTSGKRGPGDAVEDYTDTFPMPVTQAVLHRGQQRYTIYCAVCHDPLGTGHGKIVERGFTPPPSLQIDLSRGFRLRGKDVPLREVPPGYIFEVVSRGFGAMPDYASQVPPADRWAIAAYVRALQLSQQVKLADLPPEVRDTVKTKLEGQP